MKENITSVPELHHEAQRIQHFLEIAVSEDFDEAMQRGMDLAYYIARTGKMLADAKYHRDELMKNELMSIIKEVSKLPISTTNKLVTTACRDANHLVTWCDRLNRTATHQLEWCKMIVETVEG